MKKTLMLSIFDPIKIKPPYTTQVYVQLVAATVGVNQLNAGLNGCGFLIGARQRFLIGSCQRFP